MSSDLHTRFHETWLGMVQPVEGLVVSIPVLAEAQCMERHGPELQQKFHAACPLYDSESGLELDEEAAVRGKRERAEFEQKKRQASRRYRSLPEFLKSVLGWSSDLYDQGDALPENLSRYITEGHQTIRPTLALRKLAVVAESAGTGVRSAARAVRIDEAADSEGPDADENEESDDEDGDSDADGDTDEEGQNAPPPRTRALSGMPDIETPESAAGKAYIALVWDLPTGLAFDKPETETGEWRYPPAAKFDRLLRACRVPIGLLTNGVAVRLVFAPHGETTGTITFDLAEMGEVAGRPILDAFVMLVGAFRFFGVGEDAALPALLRASRERQANVTNTLAGQVFEALDFLLQGFEGAARRDGQANLRALLELAQGRDPATRMTEDDHIYGGLLTVLLRLVFLLYAEDRELLPIDNESYQKSLSVSQLFEDLQRDHGAFPDTMGRRFGAWPRLLALFRSIHDGVEHGEFEIPRRRGELFDPSRFPFLEGWGLPDTAVAKQPEDMAQVAVPTIDDETVFSVLERLMILEGQRLSYKVLDVEQIGSVYEALMGYGVTSLTSPAVCCRHKSLQPGSRGGVWIDAALILEQKPASRSKFLSEEFDVVKGEAKRIAAELKAARNEAEVLEALEHISLKRVPRRSAGQLALQPGEERRRTSSHYTPRSLSQPIVRRTLEPLLTAMSDIGEPTSAQLLSLKVCDPAMGSGAFLVEACRFLADHVVAAWEREGQTDKIASAKEDVVNHARRLVAQRCLYGVDKNPFAVSLAKLSLWLVTLAKDEPFTFVDHALRHGDSLVGLSFEQIKAFHWVPEAQMDLIEKELTSCIEESLHLRQQILDLAGDSSPGVTRFKEQLLWDANDAQERARIIGDLVVGAFFDSSKKDRDGERKRRLDDVRTWLAEGGVPPANVEEMSKRIRRRIPVFHWWLEFPEVFHRERPDPLAAGEANRTALMDAVIGNPPFAGKNGISRVNGADYLDWLKVIHVESHGNADLSAHFFRRADSLLGAHGTIGLIATNTIAQGDTRASGLRPLLARGYLVFDATRSMSWPGTAAVTVSVVHLAKGAPALRVASRRLDGLVVGDINSRLRGKPERPDPVSLSANAGMSFVGFYVLGMGFTLTREERADLVRNNRKNGERTFPYLGGKEVNTSPTQDFERYVISFGQMELEEAKRWPELLSIVRERVKPERDKNKRDVRRNHWWRFGETAPALCAALGGTKRCLVTSIHSKHLILSFQPADRIFSHGLYVFPLSSYGFFACLQSRIHETWARLLSGSLEDRLRYSASDCFETFPFPPESAIGKNSDVEEAGRVLYETRANLMVTRQEGLTTTYNQLKDSEVSDVEELRRLHLAMDRAVLAAYGWQDIEPPPFTYPVSDGDWMAIGAFEDEIIDRLFALNIERAAEERVLGIIAKNGGGKATNSSKPRTKASANQLSLGSTTKGTR